MNKKMNELKKRKTPRLQDFDYSGVGAYFITVCTLRKRSIISNAVGYLNMNASREIHKNGYMGDIWQRSFHDHIIRGEQDYLKIWNYIDINPQKWNEDCFYIN